MADTAHWQPRVEHGCLFIDDAEFGGAMLQHHARPGIGSYIHPLRIGPRHLCLTEDSPWHHPHQHGIQTRFVGINGSDFWHFPGQRPGKPVGRINPGLPRITGTEPPRWVIEALWQHADGRHVLADRQEWQLGRAGGVLVLDLDWTLRAIPDARIEPYLYGGLYVRMPYRSHLGAQVVTSAGNKDGDAEQQPAAWVDVHMPIDQARRPGDPPASAGIAVFDHPANPAIPRTGGSTASAASIPRPASPAPSTLPRAARCAFATACWCTKARSRKLGWASCLPITRGASAPATASASESV